jgi:hypothetical protein
MRHRVSVMDRVGHRNVATGHIDDVARRGRSRQQKANANSQERFYHAAS